MKIKELAEKLNVTQKTIRYYEEQKLIAPEKTEINGRAFREYSDEQIALLRDIITLRQHCFTIEEIKSIQENPELIKKICQEHLESINNQLEMDRFLQQVYERINKEDIDQTEELVSKLAQADREVMKSKQDWNIHICDDDYTFSEDVLQKREKEALKQKNARENMFGALSSNYAKCSVSGNILGF